MNGQARLSTFEDNFPYERETKKKGLRRIRDNTKDRGEIFEKSLASSERKETLKTMTDYVQKKKQSELKKELLEITNMRAKIKREWKIKSRKSLTK